MATTYKLVQRRDMHKGATEGDKLYYAQAKSTGTSDMERLCSMIGERSCVSSADVKAVLDSLIYVMKLEMSDGKIVQLGEFGNFRITFGSEGTKVEKDFNATKIRRPKYTFSPGKALRSQAKVLRFEKVSVEKGEGTLFLGACSDDASFEGEGRIVLEKRVRPFFMRLVFSIFDNL